MKKIKIAFVCTGCTDRSPMAVWIANAIIQNNKLGHLVEVCARGLFVEPAAKVNSKAVLAVERLGIPARTKVVPKELCAKDFETISLCLCMTPEQKAIIKSKFGVDAKTIAEAADCFDIADPYGGAQDAYDKTAKALDAALEQIFERMFKRRNNG